MDTSPSPLDALGALVLKNGVGLGGLGDEARALALGFVWAGIGRAPMDEKAVNAVLRAQLDDGAAVFLATDHVELRRWLCDAGWLLRDGFGREYRRQPPAAVPERHRSLAAALESAFDGPGDTAAFTRARRAAKDAERAARRRAHEDARTAQAGLR